MQSLGYKQAVKVLMEGLPINEAVYECQKETRHYAKRQMTWFRCESGVEWLKVSVGKKAFEIEHFECREICFGDGQFVTVTKLDLEARLLIQRD